MGYKDPPKEHQFTSENQPEGRGRPKGSYSLSTIIRNIEDDLDWEKVPIKNNAELKQTYGKRGWEAIVYVAIGQAISGDRHAREWLRKAGYGDKVDITSDGDQLNIALVKFVDADGNINTE